MHNCPLWASKQTSARIDFLGQGGRLVDKKALIILKFTPKSLHVWTDELTISGWQVDKFGLES